MNFDLAHYEARAQDAVKVFWHNRAAAQNKQLEADLPDMGTRGAVTAGKNMDGFLALARMLIEDNGFANADICTQQRALTLPGFFRPTKIWDLLVMHQGNLVAAFEFKSQVGPSFGNNFNNRSEEAIGTAHDLWMAHRNGAFGKSAPRPFIGLIMLLEDCAESNTPVTEREPHFPVDRAFKGQSYAQRYDLLCQRLVKEELYSSATLFVLPHDAATDGRYRHLSQLTSLETFVAKFMNHSRSLL